MVKSFHPRRGKGKVKYKANEKEKQKQSVTQETRNSFDWEPPAEKQLKSTLNSCLVLVTVICPPPGSGVGLIPLRLPRQGWMAEQELIQLKSLQWEAYVSSKNLIALSFYDLRISSDYRLNSKNLLEFNSCKMNSLPVYSVIILSPSTPFLYLSP